MWLLALVEYHVVHTSNLALELIWQFCVARAFRTDKSIPLRYNSEIVHIDCRS